VLGLSDGLPKPMSGASATLSSGIDSPVVLHCVRALVIARCYGRVGFADPARLLFYSLCLLVMLCVAYYLSTKCKAL